MLASGRPWTGSVLCREAVGPGCWVGLSPESSSIQETVAAELSWGGRRAKGPSCQGVACTGWLVVGHGRGVTGSPVAEVETGLSSPEKTRQLLFRGARACAPHAWEEDCDVAGLPESPPPGRMGTPQVLRGQLLIGPDGRLTRSRAETDLAGVAPGACSSLTRAADSKAACGQCALADCSANPEKPLCAGCAVLEG
ncbi:PREDICTED: apoptosis regulatory protein Siva [Condylura cristata]|uniref:apoptosis regulatory protein Siva n=1 Tax=Condylura cristata TaxID=143302 RepID=UPI000643CC8A|nr:PREDICTED: apoptosis regulatory protein Siva [Condylura cristata]